jgi:hypothetical protein
VEEGPHTHIHTIQHKTRLHANTRRPVLIQKRLRLHLKEAAATSTEAAATSKEITKRPQLQITHSGNKEATASKREINACTRTIEE